VTKNVAAKKPAPALAKNTAKNTAKTTAKPNKDDAAKATKTAARPASTPVANKNVKTQDIKQSAKLDAKAAAKPAPAKSTPAATSSKEKAPAQPPQKPAPTAIKASKTASKPAAKKQDADTAKLAAPVVVRPKIALASGSSAPYAAPQTPVVQNAPTAANDQNKTAPDTKAATPKPAATKNGVHRTGYRVNEYIVYPAHGVGQIIAIEEQEVAGFSLELFVINFMKDKMTLKVPLPKVLAGAIRKLADSQTVNKALETLTGRARIKRTMWSRRAQEYEAKINSGDIGSIAEVVRDLYRSETQPEQSYSERQLYEAALDRMMREIAAVQKLIDSEALKLIEQHLQRGPKRGAKTEASELSDNEVDESDLDAETEGDVEEAA
jgi:CarD family transcriptional regulator